MAEPFEHGYSPESIRRQRWWARYWKQRDQEADKCGCRFPALHGCRVALRDENEGENDGR